MALTKENLILLVAATTAAVTSKGADFYAWKNPPKEAFGFWTQEVGFGEESKEINLTPKQAEKVFTDKLNGAYGERFAMSVGTVAALVNNGYNVRIIQYQKEIGTPFDASGWLVILVETMPVFHVAPWDLNAHMLSELVEIVSDNTAEDVSWKGTNKVGEFKALLRGSLQGGLDLVRIAKEGSK